MNFFGKVALVTGAGSPRGIGFATARFLVQQGAKVAVTSTTRRIEDRARELSAENPDILAIRRRSVPVRPRSRAGSRCSRRFPAVAFLASEAASYITGRLIVIDGGNSIQE